ncbi:MAG: hypothetical protein FJ091_20320 [Deltaproteobacteria bacterium]|nr:hypothetical protein [Deltaproteobacteria bacterium]
MIESENWVWFVEAKFKSDISKRTTTRETRDQILRNLDVGSNYAGVRPFHFTLLLTDTGRSKLGVDKVREYQDLNRVRRLLPHRADQARNLASVTLLEWRSIGALLERASQAEDPYEKLVSTRALEWMRKKGLA